MTPSVHTGLFDTIRVRASGSGDFTSGALKGILLVQDNLSTHSHAAYSATFASHGANQPAARFEFHSTPQLGSRLNAQELEMVHAGPTALILSERVGDQAVLERLMLISW
jgi:hypothetical protein